jgi:hypothetical protein
MGNVFVLVLSITAALGCGGGSSSSCPSTAVSLDAGLDGLPDVGENGSLAFCRQICGQNVYACCRTKDIVVTCTPMCK